MTQDRAELWLLRMQENIQDALEFAEGLTLDRYKNDRRTRHAISLNLFLIGETAAKIITQRPEIVELSPSIPWQQLRGLRNVIAHDYFALDLDQLWDTITIELPRLGTLLAELLLALRQPNE